jgi:hypothetical protein
MKVRKRRECGAPKLVEALANRSGEFGIGKPRNPAQTYGIEQPCKVGGSVFRKRRVAKLPSVGTIAALLRVLIVRPVRPLAVGRVCNDVVELPSGQDLARVTQIQRGVANALHAPKISSRHAASLSASGNAFSAALVALSASLSAISAAISSRASWTCVRALLSRSSTESRGQ